MSYISHVPVSSIIGRTHFSASELQPHQQEAVDTIRTILKQLLLSASTDSNRINTAGTGETSFALTTPWYDRTDRPTQVISIFGERGQGKTATLYSLCRILATEGQRRSPYLIVPALDPELLGHDVDMFTALAYYLQLAIRQESPSSEGISSQSFRQLEEELMDFVALSVSETQEGRALSVDMSGSLEAYTKRTTQQTSRRLDRLDKFALWIDSFLRCSQRGLLIFPIDDVDINREHSEQLLQAVRLYLCHPRVVVILTAELEMIRRSIRNRLLKELPDVFTGGQAEVPAKDNATESSFLFGPAHRSHLLAQEFQADDKYAQQFLQKVLPPAYRVHLRGLRADERQRVYFTIPSEKPGPSNILTHDGASVAATRDSLEQVLASAPLLSGIVYDAAKGAVTTLSVEYITVRLANVLESASEPSFTGKTLLSWIGTLYPSAFPSILRSLLNQIVTLRALIESYRCELKRILDGNTPMWSCPPFEADDDTWRLDWHPLITAMTSLSETDSHLLHALQTAEDIFMA
jgi:hypothetical protein